MDIETLDRVLRKLSDSEVGYKNGTKKSFWEEIGNESGEPIIINNKGLRIHEGTKEEDRNFGVILPELNMSVNRNSRFDAVPMHIHEYIELSYVYSGRCPEVIRGEDVVLEQGQVLLLDTNVPHSVAALGENDIMINLLLEKDYLYKNLFNHLSQDSVLSQFFINALANNTAHNRYIHFHSEKSRRVQMYFKELLCECCDPSINSTDIITNLFALIITELLNVYETEKVKGDYKEDKDNIIPILHYIEANFKTCTRTEVANLFHVSEKHLTNLIKKHTGQTFIELVQAQKLSFSTKLLRNTKMPITDIINECGYENANFYYKKFKETYGMSPKDYRNNLFLNGQ
jgi:AraC-like DNA-binding protein/mannose-6-phosphate isomerase-like protein (cupin superfamily)